MSFITTIDKIKYIDYLMQIEGTGSPEELSRKLKISKRSVYNLISLMKEIGAPIKYNKNKKTYYYQFKVDFVIKFIKN
ncbi:MAG: helix-turn-helix domain-containing protein [Marinifilaceae bacterium]|nr:helix-turn-helix domain-containing protein [Marinifilaceae bacterium]